MAVVHAGILLVLIFIPKVTNAQSYNITYKCCGMYQQFDSSGRCVEAQWPSAGVDTVMDKVGAVSARNESWVSRWHPPGPPRDRLVQRGVVFHSILSNVYKNRPGAIVILNHFLADYHLTAPVKNSLFYRDAKGIWANNAVLYGGFLLRSRPDNRIRRAFYCLDAMEGANSTYVVVFRTLRAAVDDLFSKCCRLGEVVVAKRSGNLDCGTDSRAWTDPANASFSNYLDLETPFIAVSTMMKNVRQMKLLDTRFHTSPLPPGDVRLAKYSRVYAAEFLFSTWLYPCADLKREENGDLTDVLGYFLVTRRTRAAYMISRNLSFVAALILLAALVAIGCKERMRSSAHGWALGCHVVCLLFFNIGQIVYSLTLSAEIANSNPISPDQNRTCLMFAIPMYFLLTAANAWMTAVSANMFFGFKMTGATLAGGREKKRFMKLSAFAWSVATALTGANVAAFFSIHEPMMVQKGNVQKLLWYRPTFVETRTCYSEIMVSQMNNLLQYRSQKLGTALYYYVPTFALVAANGVLLWLTGRKVRYLRRGNSLLKKDEREGGGGRNVGRGHQNKASTAEPKSVTVYIKLLLAGGVIEFLAEMLTWGVSSFKPSAPKPSEDTRIWANVAEYLTFQLEDHMHAHRTTGYWVDVFRALVVLWLAVPKPPNMRALWRRMRGLEGDSPARGAATRPAARPAARPAPRRGQQESPL